MEEERQLLLVQLQTLMNQLQGLLTELISSKDTYANEQRTYLSVLLLLALRIISCITPVAFSALTLLVGCQEWAPGP